MAVVKPTAKSFGVIFMCDSEQTSFFTPVRSEYLARVPLTLGVEITKIAVDAVHIPEVNAYLSRYGITNVAVLPLERIKERYLLEREPYSKRQVASHSYRTSWL